VCREDAATCRESIEVFGSHCGLGVNPNVILAIADRLAQAEGKWAPFEPPRWTSWAFPAPRRRKPLADLFNNIGRLRSVGFSRKPQKRTARIDLIG
jgi:hypothetical protein